MESGAHNRISGWHCARALLAGSLSLSALIILITPRPSHAQQPAPTPPPIKATDLAPVRGVISRGSNLVGAKIVRDSFTGQGTAGPYVLSFQKILFGPGQTTNVFIDSRKLAAGEFTVDPIKGELNFLRSVRKNQTIVVEYEYDPAVAKRNENASQTAALAVSLAQIGIANVQMTALPGAGAVPRVVWGVDSATKLLGGGFTSKLLMNADRGDDETRDLSGDWTSRSAMALGYKMGDAAKNGLDLSFSRGGKEFASSVGKNFGYASATETRGFKGALSPTPWLGFSMGRGETRDLSGKGDAITDNLGIKLGGTKGAPSLGFSRGKDEKRDGAGAFLSGTKTEAGDFAGKFGVANLTYKRNLSDVTAPDKKRTYSASDAYAFALPASKPGRTALGFSSTSDDKIDPNGAISETSLQKGTVDKLFGRLDFSATRSYADVTAADKKRNKNQQQTLALNLPAAKPGQMALGLRRVDDLRIDPSGIKTELQTDTLETSKLFGALNLTATSQDGQVTGADSKVTDVEQKALAVSFAAKNQPALSLGRTDDLRVGPGGERTSTQTDKLDLTHKVGPANLVAKVLRADTQLPGEKTAAAEQQNIAFTLAPPKQPSLSINRVGDVKVDANGARLGALASTVKFLGTISGLGIDMTRVSSDISAAGKKRAAGEGLNLGLKYGGAKGVPGLSVLRLQDEKREDGDWFGTITDRYDIAHAIGSARLNLQWLQVDGKTSDQKLTTADTQTIGVVLPGDRTRPTVGIMRIQDARTDLEQKATSTVTEKLDLAQKVGTSQVAATNTHTVIVADDPKVTGTAQETSVSVTAPTGSPKQKGSATVAVTSGEAQNGAQVEEKQGLALKLHPSANLSLSAEQRDTTITPLDNNGVMGASRVITGQTASAEIVPMAGTRFTTAWTSQEDGPNRMSIMDLGATLGHDKSAFQLIGSLRQRNGLQAGGTPALDTANAKFAVRPFAGVTFSGLYTMNPEDPKDKTKLLLTTRREYAMNAKVGAFELGGTFAMTSFGPGAAAATIQQAGATEFGETAFTLGLRFSRFTSLTGSYKDLFFFGAPTPRGLRTINIGFKHDIGTAMNLSVTGVIQENQAAATAIERRDVRAEAKLGVKF